jgi:uncharacterized membrane protein YqjE
MAASQQTSASDPGLRSSLRGLGHSLLSLLRVRAELLGIEFAEEKDRLQATLILSVVAVVSVALAVQVLTFLVIALFWDTYRLQAIAGVAAFYVLVAVMAAWGIHRKWSRPEPPFAVSLQELRNDMDALRGKP